MKIALFQFNTVILRPVLLNLIKELGITEIHNFWPLPAEYSIEEQLPAGIRIYNHYNDTLKILSSYTGVFDYSSLKPLDLDLMKKLSVDEHMCKRTLQRWPKMYPALFNPEQKGVIQAMDRWLNFTGHRFNSTTLTYNETHLIYLRLVRLFNHIYTTHKIDLYLSEFLPHGGVDNVGFAVAKALNIPTVFGFFTPATSYEYFMNHYETPQDEIPVLMEKLRREGPVSMDSLRPDTREEYKRLTNDPDKQTIPFVGDFGKISEINKKTREYKNIPDRLAAGMMKAITGDSDKKTGFYNKLASLFIKMPWNKKHDFYYKWDKLYSSLVKEPDFNDNFLYVTLHSQPEASSEPIGDYYSYQELMIDMLSYYLPKGWFLYIKEHRKLTDYNYRPLSFYKHLAALPNVKFISKDFSTFRLIENCKAVAALTSTAGWEGLFKNKAFLMFGNQVTMYAPGVFKIRSGEDCKTAMEKVMAGVEIKHEDLLYYLKALDMLTIPTNSSRFAFSQKSMSDEEWTAHVSKGYLEKIKKTLNKVELSETI